MIFLALTMTLLLSWSLGKNNLSNLFGTAVGTNMVRLKTATTLAIIFIFIGAFFSGSGTTSTVLKIADLKTETDILIISLSALIVLEIMSRIGIPASIVQTIIGSLIGWDIYHHVSVDQNLIKKMLCGWFCAPLIAMIISFLLLKATQHYLKKHPIPLFTRDTLLRIGLILMGSIAAYMLGANNISTIISPYLNVFSKLNNWQIVFAVCCAVGLGCKMANKKVITTVGHKLFPLSPTEAFISIFATTISMMCFSIQAVREFLLILKLPLFPLIPIPMTSVLIGSICGISIAKGGNGLHFSVLGHIILSWILVPIIAGLLSGVLLLLLGEMG
jgi:PiT family inorganic phosphate transporter